MRKFLGLLLILMAVSSTFGSPLVFKAEKIVKSDGKSDVELATFDSSKYKELRIGVSLISGNIDKYTFVYVHALEDENLLFIGSIQLYEISSGRTAEFTNLPKIIRLTTKYSGTYKIYVWASQ